MDDATEAHLVLVHRSDGGRRTLSGHWFHQGRFSLVLAEVPPILNVLVIHSIGISMGGMGRWNLWSRHCLHQWSCNPTMVHDIGISLGV